MLMEVFPQGRTGQLRLRIDFKKGARGGSPMDLERHDMSTTPQSLSPRLSGFCTTLANRWTVKPRTGLIIIDAHASRVCYCESVSFAGNGE
jgi:hypothetical protein